jgi:hypothetical protein
MILLFAPSGYSFFFGLSESNSTSWSLNQEAANSSVTWLKIYLSTLHHVPAYFNLHHYRC